MTRTFEPRMWRRHSCLQPAVSSGRAGRDESRPCRQSACATLALLILSVPAFAAYTGTVVNRTTNKPLSNATVTLYGFGAGGMQPVDHVTTDAQGNFSIDRTVTGGPAMLRVEVDNVIYNKMCRPGSPTTNLTIDVYNATSDGASTKVSKHMLLFEPADGKLNVTESFLVENTGKTTWADPKEGTLHYFLPEAAGGDNVEVKATAPDGMPVPIPTTKTSKPDVYAAKFEIKPGETRFDLNYAVPYKEGDPYEGKIASKDDNTYLMVPNGVTMKADGATDIGTEPRTQVHIYGLKAAAYKIELTGAAVAPAASDSADQNEGAPQIEEILPRVYNKLALILAFALGILALGFVILYRSGPHERAQR